MSRAKSLFSAGVKENSWLGGRDGFVGRQVAIATKATLNEGWSMTRFPILQPIPQ